MSGPVDEGSHSQPADAPLVRDDLSSSSQTIAFVPHSHLVHPESGVSEGGEDERTVISQRPVAAPEEFYRSMPLSELAAMLEGRQLDHFAVEQMIGGGGMGAVFRGRDLRLDRVVAIKVIPAARRDQETLRRFRLEAQAAAKLDHPNIARVYYVGEAQQWNYIVFEFIDGVNIRDLVEMEGPLTVDDAVYYTRQVAEALQHAYEREVVHRDIKPSNVLVTATGAAKVVDMGLARHTALDRSTADETASGITLGTFDYISPEQARNPRDADVRSDLYSLGCTLFYMLTGHPPFPEGTALQKLLSHGSQAPPDPRGWRDDLSDELYQITMKLMAKRPSDRYQTPAELISDLIMLAEVEDLPRSQSPGTLLVSPNIAQHSLLETNLPWLVALGFLLGSTLWLASVEKLSPSYEISELDFASPAGDAPAPEAQESNPPLEGLPVAPASGAPSGTLPTGVSGSEPLPTTNSSAGLNGNSLRPTTELPNFLPSQLPSAASSPVPFAPPGAAQAVRRLVVSSEMPTDVDPQRWESSLASAVQRLAYDEAREADGSQEIEVRGRISLPRELDLRGLNLRLIAGGGSATIEVAPEWIVSSNEAQGAIRLEASKLKIQGIAFLARVPDGVAIKRQGLFSLRGSTQLELEDCTVTIHDPTASGNLQVFACNDTVLANTTTKSRLAGLSTLGLTTPLVSGEAATSQVAGNSLLLRTSMCVFRGDAHLVRLNISESTIDDRADLSFSNSLVAVTGSVLDIYAPTGEPQPQRFVRVLCDQSTFASEQAFAQVTYAGNRVPLVGLLRTSQSCIYWSRAQVPHMLIRGAPRESILGNFNLLLLQGMNNLYDANTEDLCLSYQGQELIAAFGFVEAATSGWLAERGNESRVRWQNAAFPPAALRDATPADFAVADLLFVPGIAPQSMPSLQ